LQLSEAAGMACAIATLVRTLQQTILGRNFQQPPFSKPRFWYYRDSQSIVSGIAADACLVPVPPAALIDPIHALRIE
jgi:hypothetical protein